MLATSTKWGNSPVTTHSGTIDDIRRHIPSFERRPFPLHDANKLHFRENLRLDTVVRLPHEDDSGCVPVLQRSRELTLGCSGEVDHPIAPPRGPVKGKLASLVTFGDP